jgi:hypothetical protein
MDVGFAARVTIIAGAAVLALALLALGVRSAPHRAPRVGQRQRGHLVPIDSANFMSYIAATMAVTLGGAMVLTR